MKTRRSYKEVVQLNPESTKVILIPVIDDSASSSQRTQEVIATAAKIIYLASKRGPVRKLEHEGDEYAA